MPLDRALRIDGAESAALITAGRVTWWAGVQKPDAEVVTALATAAAALVRPDDDFGDVLVTTGTAFHLLRPVDADRVAYLVLGRRAALAMARYEFKVLVEKVTTVDEPPVAVILEPDIEVGVTGLPKRLPSRRRNGAPAAAVVREVPAGWLELMGQPYETDDRVLDRILGTLKQL